MSKREVRKLSDGRNLQPQFVRSSAPVSAELSAVGFQVAQHARYSGDSESMAVRTSSPRVSELHSSVALPPSASEVASGLQPSAAASGAVASASGAHRVSAAELAFLAPYAASARAPGPESAARPDDDPLMTRFFEAGDDAGLDDESQSLGTRERLAMRATLAMLAVSLVAMSSFLYYYRVVMPVPIALGEAPAASVQRASADPPHVVPAASGKGGLASLLEQAQVFARRGQDQRALDAYDRALQLQPGEASALAGKAYAYLNLDDRLAAKRFASLAVAADPTSAQGWVVLGAAEELLGSRRAAQDAFRRCAAQGVGGYVHDCRQLVR